MSVDKMNTIKTKVKTFIVDNFLFGADEGLNDQTSFLDEGIIDSTGVLELVEFLEKSFEITVEDDELVPENLDSIESIATFVHDKSQTA